MLLIFNGTRRVRDQLGNIISEGRSAGEIQKDVETSAQVPCEQDRHVSHKKEGRCDIEIKTESLAEAKTRIKEEHKEKHLPFDASAVTEKDLHSGIVKETILDSPREVYISPEAIKEDGDVVTMEDFLDGFTFGNGVTANATVGLKDGSSMCLTWCVFPDGTALTKPQKKALANLIEQ